MIKKMCFRNVYRKIASFLCTLMLVAEGPMTAFAAVGGAEEGFEVEEVEEAIPEEVQNIGEVNVVFNKEVGKDKSGSNGMSFRL